MTETHLYSVQRTKAWQRFKVGVKRTSNQGAERKGDNQQFLIYRNEYFSYVSLLIRVGVFCDLTGDQGGYLVK